MILENNKIVEATENELFGYYLSRGYDDVMDFHTFKQGCQKGGTRIEQHSTAKQEVRI